MRGKYVNATLTGVSCSQKYLYLELTSQEDLETSEVNVKLFPVSSWGGTDGVRRTVLDHRGLHGLPSLLLLCLALGVRRNTNVLCIYPLNVVYCGPFLRFAYAFIFLLYGGFW